MKVLYDELSNFDNLKKYQSYFCFEEDDFACYGIKPFAMLSVFQHVATNHAIKLNVGFDDMIKQNLLWVTMRIKYELLADILPNQKLKIVTYPSGKNMMEYDRDYIIFDEQNNMLAKGQSKWCLIDANTRHIKRMIDCPILLNDEPIFENRFFKTEAFEPVNCADLRYGVKQEDIDANGHANNTVYAKILESLLERYNKKICFFQINFLKEAMLKDMLDIYLKQDNNKLIFVGKKFLEDNCFTAEVIFKQ